MENLKNEALINRIEELKEESQMDVPNEIISLLDSSNAADQSGLVVHTKKRIFESFSGKQYRSS